MSVMINDGQAMRARRRAEMRCWRAAMEKALDALPGPEGFDTALELADYLAEDPGLPRRARIAWGSVVQFERLHPDLIEWAPVLVQHWLGDLARLDDALDGLFELAMAIEARDAGAEAAARDRMTELLDA